ncbi:hypothetical protein LA03_09035 [Burkholderia gladioli]|nr:hypothetical protein LA03_09035 [Burkholderia gladioli]
MQIDHRLVAFLDQIAFRIRQLVSHRDDGVFCDFHPNLPISSRIIRCPNGPKPNRQTAREPRSRTNPAPLTPTRPPRCSAS